MRLILIFSIILGSMGFGIYKASQFFSPDYQREKMAEKRGEDVSKKDDSPQVNSEPLNQLDNNQIIELEQLREEKKQLLEAKLRENKEKEEERALELAKAKSDLKLLEEREIELKAELEKKNAEKLVSLPFLHRPVPPVSSLTSGSSVNTDSFNVIVDKTSNSWLVRGNGEFHVDMSELVKSLDVAPNLYDLDFLYVAISENKIKNLGLQAMFSDGASYLNAVNLGFDTLGMNLVLNNVKIDFNFQKRDEDLNVVTLPVQRITTGSDFTFGNVDQIPIQSQSVSDGISTAGFNYRAVGLSLSGRIDKIGNKLLLNLDQSLGTVVPSTDSSSSIPPVLREANSKSSSFLVVNQWSCFSGMLVERSVWSKGLLSKRRQDSRDLVLMFVRPRDTLKAIPRAIPVNSSAINNGHPLLPNKK